MHRPGSYFEAWLFLYILRRDSSVVAVSLRDALGTSLPSLHLVVVIHLTYG